MVPDDPRTIERWLLEAYEHAKMSPDPSTQNGAIIVDRLGARVAYGCNTFPRQVFSDISRLGRPQKYLFIEHAERNTIYFAARKGCSLDGGTMVCPWFACADCARGIIESGITTVIGHKWMMDRTPSHWRDSIDAAFTMFREAQTITHLYDGPIPDAPTILMNGEEFRPW